MSVVFPTPFAPTRAACSPSPTRNDTSSKSWRPPGARYASRVTSSAPTSERAYDDSSLDDRSAFLGDDCDRVRRSLRARIAACVPARVLPRARRARGVRGRVGVVDDRAARPGVRDDHGRRRPNILFVLTDDLDRAELRFMPHTRQLIGDERRDLRPLLREQLAVLPVARHDAARAVRTQHRRLVQRWQQRRLRACVHRGDRAGHRRHAAQRVGLSHRARRQVPQRLSEHGRSDVPATGLDTRS